MDRERRGRETQEMKTEPETETQTQRQRQSENERNLYELREEKDSATDNKDKHGISCIGIHYTIKTKQNESLPSQANIHA